jgi:hypothetical protein
MSYRKSRWPKGTFLISGVEVRHYFRSKSFPTVLLCTLKSSSSNLSTYTWVTEPLRMNEMRTTHNRLDSYYRWEPEVYPEILPAVFIEGGAAKL